MKSSIRLLALIVMVIAAVAVADVPVDASGAGAVFVQTNDPGGNAIAVFHRNADGTLTYVASHATGGSGGRETGSMSDPLASQGSLVQIPNAGLLVNVNAGSDTISVFAIDGDHLSLKQQLPSNGPFPTSLAVHANLVYVLDAGGAGSVSGYRITGGALEPIPGSTRSLGLANAPVPFFLSSPAEVGFTPDGAHLIVTTKTNGTVDVFSVGAGGQLSASPVKNPAGPVPFAFVFDGNSRMVLSFAGNSSLQVFTVDADGTITAAGAPTTDGQGALCWITGVRGYQYTSNTASNDVSQFRVVGSDVALTNATAATNIPGAIDSDEPGGSTLYVQGGLDGSIHVFSFGTGGSLSSKQVVTVPDGVNQEGISAD